MSTGVKLGAVLEPRVRVEALTWLGAYAEAKANRDEAQEQMDGARTNLETLRAHVGEQCLDVDGNKITLVAPLRQPSLAEFKKRLLARGVSADLLKEASE